MTTAAGPARLARHHSHCPACAGVVFAADGLLGLDGPLTARACRMATLAGVSDPFRKAERLPGEPAGWSVDAETVRRLTHAEADLDPPAVGRPQVGDGDRAAARRAERVEDAPGQDLVQGRKNSGAISCSKNASNRGPPWPNTPLRYWTRAANRSSRAQVRSPAGSPPGPFRMRR